MPSTPPLIKSKGVLTRDELANFLIDVAEGIRAGNVTFEGDGTNASFTPPESLRLDVEMKDSPKRQGVKHELELELSWLERTDGGPADVSSGALRVV